MTRLLVHVEGQTEEDFVNEVLRRHLFSCGYTDVSARLIGNARQRSKRGGGRPWSSVKTEITNHLNSDRGCIATTMVDYYGMPQDGSRAWPGRERASTLVSNRPKSKVIEQQLLQDIARTMGNRFDPSRFVPFVMMHEFEALLFSDCRRFAEGIGEPNLAPDFQAIRNGFPSPEGIDDSPDTAPSKRIEALFPKYEKPLMGSLAALEIGLPRMRSECLHFDCWLQRLEQRVSVHG